MPEGEGQPFLREALRSLVVLCVWAIWLPFSGLRALLRLVAEFLHAHSRWLRRALWAGPAAVLLVAVFQVGPLVYGRFALLSEARHQARTSLGRDSGELVGALRQTAFDLGFKDVIDQAEAFSVESDSDTDGESLCVVNIQLGQRVRLLGCLPFVFHVRKKVASPITPTDFKKKRQEERALAE